MVSSAVPVLLCGIWSHLFIFVLFFMILTGGSKKNLSHFMSKCILLFFLKNFILSVLLFGSLIYLEFIFVYTVREYSNFILITISKKKPCTLFFIGAVTNSPFH